MPIHDILSSLINVSLPVATTIGLQSFYGCTSLGEVSLPTVASIANYAFYDCVSLSNISLPAATEIGEGVFDGIVGKTITLTIPHDILSSNNSSLNFLTGHNTVTIIEV